MKFYLLFSFFTFTFIFAQDKFDTEEAITEKLNYLKDNQKTLDLQKQETLLLQLKAASEKLSFEKGILLSGDYLITVYDKQNKHKEIVELAGQLKKMIKDKKEDPTGVISSIYRKNALALMYLGLDDASKKEVESAIKFAKTIENPDRRYFRLTQSYMDLFSHYKSKDMQSENKAYQDSTLYYLNKSLNVAEKIRDNNGEIDNDRKYAEIIYIYMYKGIFYLEHSDQKDNLQLAEKNLLKAEEISKAKGGLSTREEAVLLNQMSWLYMEKKEYQKSIDYANRALQLEKKGSRPTARIESFEFLATCYMEIGDKEKSKFYMREYTFLKDSLSNVNRKNANIAATKIATEVKVEEQEKSRKQLIAVGGFILIAASVGVFLWRRNNKKLRKNYELIIEKLNNPDFNATETVSNYINDKDIDDDELLNNDKTQDDTSANRNIISKETEARILKRLETFERTEKFLKKDLTISTLSAQLNTNSKYLSEIIKNNKSLSFSTYINTLRINYIVHKLYNEPKFRVYKISYLAEISGYASPQVFVTAFKKVNGVTPSYFLQNLEEDNI